MFLTFVLRALGYEDGTDFTWDQPFERAKEAGLLDEDGLSGVFTRGDVVRISYKSLSALIKDADFSLLEKLAAEGVVLLAGEAYDWSEWDALTENGLDEERFLQSVDVRLLLELAAELQAMIGEEAEAERADPSIVVTEGWTRIFESERWQKVLSHGKAAMKPLYWILYKSEGQGAYEYCCAEALYRLSGFDFSKDGGQGWSTAGEFFALFDAEVLKILNP